MPRILLQLGALLSLILLNSCYFNSAGHLVHAASYNHAVEMAELKRDGGCVYTDGKYDYAELTCYRVETPVITQYCVLFPETPKKPSLTPVGKRMYRISPALAAYLTGKSAICVDCSAPDPVSESRASIAARCTSAPILRSAAPARHEYSHMSPAACLLYPAACLDWLCVDVPVSCAENILFIGGFASGAFSWENARPKEEQRRAANQAKTDIRELIKDYRILVRDMESVRDAVSAARMAPVIEREHLACETKEIPLVVRMEAAGRVASKKQGKTSAEDEWYDREEDKEYRRQYRRYQDECRRLEQHDYYGSAALKRVLRS